VNRESYRFLDCGTGRRLEELGGVVVSRPAPAAAGRPGLGDAAWAAASLRFERGGGWEGDAPPDWRCRFGDAVLALRPAAQGQIGVFPEHAAVADQAAALLDSLFPGQPAKALNLFAHTGLATLRLAARPGTEVAHVDAAPASVKMARENAGLSGLSDAKVRWLVDDAVRFMRREARRGNGYQLVMADPPSFGRAGKGRDEWKFDRDVPGLLADAAGLLRGGGVLCLTCHSTGWTVARAVGAVRDAFSGWKVEGEDLRLTSAVGGNALSAGLAVYAWREPQPRTA
jgi:23S rRNA (cytosine1962-C5)-methyltransferase